MQPKSETVNNKHSSLSMKKPPNNMDHLDSAEAKKSFKITNICLIHCYNTQSHTFYSLFIFHMHSNPWTCFNCFNKKNGDLFYTGGQHRKLWVKTNAVNSWNKLGKCLERKKLRWMNWEGRNQDKKEIPGSGQNMHGYILTYSMCLKGEYLSALGSLKRVP